MPSYPYVFVNAFTRATFGGNPAVVVLLPPGALTPVPAIDTSTLGTIAKSFSQPITVFIAPPGSQADADPNPDHVAVFDIRYFVNEHPVPVCGHGTLATTKAIHRRLLPVPILHPSDTPAATFRFYTSVGSTIRARAVPRGDGPAGSDDDDDDDAWYEIELPVFPISPLREHDTTRLRAAVARALRLTDPARLGIRFIARGIGSLDPFHMVVLDADQPLDGLDVDTPALLDAGQVIVVLSHLTPGKTQAFESRVFAPAFGVPEDHVCGTAHTLLLPYYASLPDSGIKPGQETHVKQVSPRGGDLWVTLDEQRGIVVFRGNAKLFAKGELML